MEFWKKGKLQIVAGISNNNSTFLEGSIINNVEKEKAMSVSMLLVDITLRHRRFGHYHYVGINEAITWKLVTGLILESSKLQDPICEPCLARKCM